METKISKKKRVGRMGPIELDASYMEDVNRRAKRIEDALRTAPNGDRQLRLPFGENAR